MVKEVKDRERLNGWRQPGATYLVSKKLHTDCNRFPMTIRPCPACKTGLKPSRGFRWIDPKPFTMYGVCDCRGSGCPTMRLPDRVGLLWVGVSTYPSVSLFCNEAKRLGVSFRVGSIPRGIEQGKTLVLVAHAQGVSRACKCTRGRARKHMPAKPSCVLCSGTGVEQCPAAFGAFVVESVQYVLAGGEHKSKLSSLESRGVELVSVIREEEKQENLPL